MERRIRELESALADIEVSMARLWGAIGALEALQRPETPAEETEAS